MVAKLIYRGDVTLRLKHSDGTVAELKNHNTGEDLLFEVLSRALVGQSVKDDVPSYLMIYSSTDNWATRDTALVSRVYLTGKNSNQKTVTISNESVQVWAATFSATVSYNDRKAIASGAEYRIYLQNNKKQDLAFINLDIDVLSNLQTGTQLMIQWDMSIRNDADETTGV